MQYEKTYIKEIYQSNPVCGIILTENVHDGLSGGKKKEVGGGEEEEEADIGIGEVVAFAISVGVDSK